MIAVDHALSASSGDGLQKPAGGGGARRAAGILTEQWPTLAGAMDRYTQATAEMFARGAYAFVEAGVIRGTDREKLSAVAGALGIRPFDAQLLIACAIRRWALDHPGRNATKSAAARKWRLSMGERVGALVALAAVMDVLILWKWLG